MNIIKSMNAFRINFSDYGRTAKYFFDGRNKTINPNIEGRYYFHNNELAEEESLIVLENIFDYCERHNINFDDVCNIEYFNITENIIYSDDIQFVVKE